MRLVGREEATELRKQHRPTELIKLGRGSDTWPSDYRGFRKAISRSLVGSELRSDSELEAFEFDHRTLSGEPFNYERRFQGSLETTCLEAWVESVQSDWFEPLGGCHQGELDPPWMVGSDSWFDFGWEKPDWYSEWKELLEPFAPSVDPARDWLGVCIDSDDQLPCLEEVFNQFPHLEFTWVHSQPRIHFKSVCGKGGFSSVAALRIELATSEPLFSDLRPRWNQAQRWLSQQSKGIAWAREDWMGDLADDSPHFLKELGVWELTTEGQYWYAIALGHSALRDPRFITEQFVLDETSYRDLNARLVPPDEMFCAIQQADLSADSVLELMKRFGLPSGIFTQRLGWDMGLLGATFTFEGNLYPLPLLQMHFALCKVVAEAFIQGSGEFDRRREVASLVQATFSGGKLSEVASAMNFEPQDRMQMVCDLVNGGLQRFGPRLHPINVSSANSEDGYPKEAWQDDPVLSGIRQMPTRSTRSTQMDEYVLPHEAFQFQLGHEPFAILCADIHRMIVEGHQLRQCQDPQCSSMFTIHRGRSIKQNRARQDAEYCSTRCSNRVQQEKKRARDRKR